MASARYGPQTGSHICHDSERHRRRAVGIMPGVSLTRTRTPGGAVSKTSAREERRLWGVGSRLVPRARVGVGTRRGRQDQRCDKLC